MGVLPTLCACLVPVEGIRPPETGVMDGCELPYGCWESDLDLLEEQPVSLTTESSLQRPPSLSKFCLQSSHIDVMGLESHHLGNKGREIMSSRSTSSMWVGGQLELWETLRQRKRRRKCCLYLGSRDTWCLCAIMSLPLCLVETSLCLVYLCSNASSMWLLCLVSSLLICLFYFTLPNWVILNNTANTHYKRLPEN